MTLFIVVTHLLGTGHLRRALGLARSFSAAGHAVFLASGGLPIDNLDTSGITLVQLPPLQSDGVNFSRLLDADGKMASAAYLDARTGALCDALRTAKPAIVITELFPFGRRALSTEFETLLATARGLNPRPAIFCSVRDILAPPSKPSKAQRADEIISDFYTAVLVHSDPDITPLSASWPVSPDLEKKLRYTGYVAPPPPDAGALKREASEVLVSAGGGAVGDHLFRTAMEAARQTPNLNWRILVGGADGAKRSAILQSDAPPNIRLETVRPDFRELLLNAACSVSMCGYNTALDILQTGVPALLVPFDTGGEVEQGLRADSLSHLQGIEVLRDADMTPTSMADAVTRLSGKPHRMPSKIRMNGAAETVRIVTELARQAR